MKEVLVETGVAAESRTFPDTTAHPTWTKAKKVNHSKII
jgi:hypothetical protein